VRRFRNRAIDFALRLSLSLTRPGERKPTRVKKQNLSARERSFAELRFASFPLPLWGLGGLSRIEMNALRAPLTALPTQRKKCVYFLLDMADDFIDDFASPSRRAAAFREKAPQVDFGGPPSSVGLAVPHLERMALGAGDCSTRDRPGWHRKGFRLFWAWKIRRGRPGRPTLVHEVRDLIRRMCERILLGVRRASTASCSNSASTSRSRDFRYHDNESKHLPGDLV